MKNFRPQLLLGLLGLLLCLRADAADYALGLTAQPDVVLGESLTYNIAVTNTSGLLLTNVIVTDLVPSTASVFSASNSFGGISNPLPNIVIFSINVLSNNSWAVMSLTVVPTAVGTITNSIGVATSNTIPVTASITTPVFSTFSDLGVTLKGPTGQILTNDLISYTLSVTNFGPMAVSGVVLSNLLPAGINIISVIPTNQAFSNNSLIFNLGTLATNVFKQFQVQVFSTNSGTQSFSANISAPALLDADPSDNDDSFTLIVGTNVPADLSVSFLTAQAFNPRTGLVQQKVRLTNNGTNEVPSARVIVGTTNWVFNATGTNAGGPFVTHATTVAPGENVDLWLKYFILSKTPGPNPTNLTAVGVPFFQIPIPPGTNAPQTIKPLVNGDIIVEFSAVIGRTYTVLYSTNSLLSNAIVVQPKVTAHANRVQWYDDGPPATIKHPMGTTNRFYRVLQN